ncbi:hypothetical protein [Aquimarina pacifica]|uniref:hypothetical protein n=1 Tax=Aquimarina pacifica TaxID=1296415 RepID=UPI000471F5DD|nr:hypothetical protein [Aquimarina pacifica]
MKNTNIIYSIFLLLGIAFLGCTEEENDISFVNAVTAPSGISALASITQDNTGLVTLTPLGSGVSNYTIIFGDGSEDEKDITPGNSVEHIYAEGSYEITIIGYGPSGLQTETTQSLVVSFNAPENLDVIIENDAGISRQVNVTVTADYAVLFEVYFGEEEIEEPLSTNIGETVSYVYEAPGTYTIRVIAKGGAIETTEYEEEFLVTEILQPIVSAPTPPSRSVNDVISIFSDAYANEAGADYFPDWGQAGQGSGWTSFDLDGDTMLQYINLSYQGVVLGAETDLSDMEFLHLDVWTTDVTSIETSLIRPGPEEKPFSNELMADAWTSIDIPLSEYTDQGLTIGDIFQMKFVGTPWAAGTVFIDNIYFYRAATELIEFPLGFESTSLDYTWTGFGASDFSPIPADVVANPDQTGINTSATVVEIQKTSGAQTWAGASMPLSGIVDFTDGTTVKLKVWSPRSGVPIRFKMEDTTSPLDSNNSPTVFVEVEVNTQSNNAWEELSFDLTTDSSFSTSIEYYNVIIFPDFGSSGAGENFYFDDIVLTN